MDLELHLNYHRVISTLNELLNHSPIRPLFSSIRNRPGFDCLPLNPPPSRYEHAVTCAQDLFNQHYLLKQRECLDILIKEFMKEIDRRLIGANLLPDPRVHILLENGSHHSELLGPLNNTNVCLRCLLFDKWIHLSRIVNISMAQIRVKQLQSVVDEWRHYEVSHQVQIICDP